MLLLKGYPSWPSRPILRSYLNLSPNCFLPHPSQITNHWSSHHLMLTVCRWDLLTVLLNKHIQNLPFFSLLKRLFKFSLNTKTVKFTLIQAMRTQRVSKGTAQLFLEPRCRMGAGGQCLTPATCPRERELVAVVQEDEWAKCIKSGPTRTRSPDRLARGHFTDWAIPAHSLNTST